MFSNPLKLSFWSWLRLRWNVFLLRTLTNLTIWLARRRRSRLGLVPLSISISPTSTIRVPSTVDTKRKIKCYIHDPPDLKRPVPVFINIHGSGFVLDLHGVDAEICRYISSQLSCTVIDAGYVKGPEYPFPAAFYDILSVIAYVQSKPNLYDTSRIAIGGFSAGANLALVAASHLPKGTIKSVIAFYPPCDFNSFGSGAPPAETASASGEVVKEAAAPPAPGTPLPPKLRKLFSISYIPPGTDLADTRLSPMSADPDTFPPTTIIVGDADSLYGACKRFYDKLHAAGNDVVFLNAPGGGHAWERYVAKGDAKFESLRTEAFELTIKRLKEAFSK